MTTRLIALFAFLLLGSACYPGPRTHPPAPEPAPLEPAAPPAELTFAAQPGWVVETPASEMRKAQYRLPKVDGDAQDASLVVFYFGPSGGGGRAANLERWAGQFEQPDGRDSKDLLETVDRSVKGVAITEAELSGTYVAETRPGSGERVREPDWRMLAAIVEAPSGPHYVKLVGPRATVDRWEASYRIFLDALFGTP